MLYVVVYATHLKQGDICYRANTWHCDLSVHDVSVHTLLWMGFCGIRLYKYYMTCLQFIGLELQ